MTTKDTLDFDVENFFKEIENQNANDQRQTLRNLMDKYIHLTQSEYLMDSSDLLRIITLSKTIFANKTMPIYLGEKNKRVSDGDQANLCIIEATIAFLNSKECLKKIAKFDIKK